MTIKLADGRSELWQWDTGRKITFDDANIKQAHFQNHANGYGRTIDVDVEDGAAKIPDELLQADLPLTVYAYIGEESDGYTKVERVFTVKPRKRPAEYVFTPADQLTLRKIESIIGNLDDLTTTAKNNLVAAINEAAKTGSGGAGSIDLRTADGYIQYSNDGGETWENLIALADLKGEKGEKGDTGAPGPQGEPGARGPQGETGQQGPQGETGPAGPDGADGAPGQDGFSPSASVAQTGTGATITITDKTGTTTAEIKNGKDGAPGKDGTNGKDGAPGAPGTPGTNGTDGKNGTTFTPSVSAAGDLSWTNDGGKANPAPVNLKGPPGADYTLTDADKTEIAAEAAAAIAGTYLPAPASAAVGQIVKIKAVDASGKITQTEAVDLPTGGGSGDTWELITSGEMAEAASLLITTDADGAALALKSAQIIVEGATSFTKSTVLRFEVSNYTNAANNDGWSVECTNGVADNPDIRAVYIAEQNKIPTLYAEIPKSGTAWATNVSKVQAARKKAVVNNADTYSFDPLTTIINRIYVGNYMGNGKLGAGCKYQIWGIRA